MYLSRRLNRSLAPPDRVSLNVTLRCNLTCTMCTTCYDAPELSLEEIKGIIDQTADWGVEIFNPLGGKPFMRAARINRKRTAAQEKLRKKRLRAQRGAPGR